MNKHFVMATLAAAMVSAQAAAEGAAPPQGQGSYQPRDMTRQEAQQRADGIFKELDLNHDGTVTRAEADQAIGQMGGRGGRMIERTFGAAQSLTLAQFEAATLAHFDSQDLNHDGTVTVAEREQARAARQAARQ